MPDTKNQPIENTDFSYRVDENYRSVYSNQAMISSTVFDFAMTFGDIVSVTTDLSGSAASATVEQRVRVIMSPLHFKIFAVTCLQNVKNYEERFGKINMPGGEDLEKAVTMAPAKANK